MISYQNKQNKRSLGHELFIPSEFHVVGILGVNTPSQASYFTITQVIDSTHLFVNSSNGMAIGNTIEQNGISTTITHINSSIEITVTSTVGFAVGVCFLVVNPPSMIKLVEVPRQDFPSSVFVSGYSETTNPNPASGQFFVDYSTGYVTFNQNASGSSVSVTYNGRGSEVDAIDANELQQPLTASFDIDGTLTPNRLIYDLLSATNPSGTLPTNDVDNYTGLVVNATSSLVITLPSPSNTASGRIFSVLNSSLSTNSITVNGTSLTVGTGASWLWDGSSWDSISGSGGGGGGSPAGSNGQVQFNNSGSFGASASFLWGNAPTNAGPNTLTLLSTTPGNEANLQLVGTSGADSPSTASYIAFSSIDAPTSPLCTLQFLKTGGNLLLDIANTNDATHSSAVEIDTTPGDGSTVWSWIFNPDGSFNFPNIAWDIHDAILTVSATGATGGANLVLVDNGTSGTSIDMAGGNGSSTAAQFVAQYDGVSNQTLDIQTNFGPATTSNIQLWTFNGGTNHIWHFGFDGGLNLPLLSGRPGSPVEGEVIYNSSTHHVEYFNGTTWVTL